jgi:iron(III) transport system substrate-binding protein
MRALSLAIFALTIFALTFAAGAVQAQDTRATKVCDSPNTAHGFATCADIAKAEQEGALVLYSPAPEPGTVKLLEEFNKLFPKIKTSYVRLQTGALYARLTGERRARSYNPDVLHLSDAGLTLEFQRANGYAAYMSPQNAAYQKRFKSTPEGLWTWGAVIMAGIVYNPKVVPPEKAPAEWIDTLNPQWTGAISVKSSNSGLQHIAWDLLKKRLGDDFWTKFATLQPKAFDSYVQQFDRIVNGDDKIAVTAQYSGYLAYKQKGAPLEFVPPKSGLPAGPEIWGVVKEAPHPEAARLFLDWFLSEKGQRIQADYVFLHSPRSDVAPPPGGLPIDKLQLLLPEDWSVYTRTRPEFVRTWNTLTGLR